jgi:hypothetical protein
VAAEFSVRPDRRLGLIIALVTSAAVFSPWFSSFGFLTNAVLSMAALGIGGKALSRAIKPRLVIRLDNSAVHYRERSDWSSVVRQPFVSPWFIGWRGAGIAGYGVFASQLSSEDFRRLAKSLRLSGRVWLE